jgi:hypothetical protein
MASSRSRRPQSSNSNNTIIYSGAAALVGLIIVLRRQLLEQVSGGSKGGKHHGKSRSVSHTPLNTPQVEAAQRELYRILPDGSRELLVPTGQSGRIAKVIIKPVKESTYAQHRKSFVAEQSSISYTNNDPGKLNGSSNHVASSSAASASTGISGAIKPAAAAGKSANQVAKKVAVNREFLRQLRAILRIIIPRCVMLRCSRRGTVRSH